MTRVVSLRRDQKYVAFDQHFANGFLGSFAVRVRRSIIRSLMRFPFEFFVLLLLIHLLVFFSYIYTKPGGNLVLYIVRCVAKISVRDPLVYIIN
jgi:hypothetical protein